MTHSHTQHFCLSVSRHAGLLCSCAGLNNAPVKGSTVTLRSAHLSMLLVRQLPVTVTPPFISSGQQQRTGAFVRANLKQTQHTGIPMSAQKFRRHLITGSSRPEAIKKVVLQAGCYTIGSCCTPWVSDSPVTESSGVVLLEIKDSCVPCCTVCSRSNTWPSA